MKNQDSLKCLFSDQLTSKAKKNSDKTIKKFDNDLGWVFVSDDMRHLKAVRTYKTLFLMQNQYTYFTPNTFFRNDIRRKDTLRWLNAFVVDVDVKNGVNESLTVVDLLDRIQSAGLPQPTQIIQTPSGGYHVYFYFAMSKRATMPVIDLYEDIQRVIAQEIGGDTQAVGAERWFRMPTEENIRIFTNERTYFEDFYDWFCINREQMDQDKNQKHIQTYDLLQHPAVISLLEGVEVGKRDNTCYTLALLFKSIGWTKSQAEAKLQEWNIKLDTPMKYSDVMNKVRSAFGSRSKQGASAAWISYLSGIKFHYQQITTAKSREERQRSHYEEWEADLLAFLKLQSNKSIQGTQKQIASKLGMSCSSFKVVIKRLQEKGEITITVNGKGRGATTTLVLETISEGNTVTNKVKEVAFHKVQGNREILRNEEKKQGNPLKIIKPVSYTSIDRVVGWDSPGFLSLFMSLPTSLQLYLQSSKLSYDCNISRDYFLLGLTSLVSEYTNVDPGFLDMWFQGQVDCSAVDFMEFFKMFKDDYIAYILIKAVDDLEHSS